MDTSDPTPIAERVPLRWRTRAVPLNCADTAIGGLAVLTAPEWFICALPTLRIPGGKSRYDSTWQTSPN
jgi:hypothetical protein